jgi:hypothetical protein
VTDVVHDIIHDDDDDDDDGNNGNSGILPAMSASLGLAPSGTSSRASRPSTPLSPTGASPIETLVHNCIPALAPPSAAGLRRERNLLHQGVGSSKAAEAESNLNEASRKEKVKELVDWCGHILDR